MIANRDSPKSDIWSSRRSRLALGTVVRVESANGHAWSGQVTSFSDRLVGLRGWTIRHGEFRERETVTLIIGVGDNLVSGRAQVLSAGGSLMRLVRRDSYGDADQRNAPRLRVELTATVVVDEVEEAPPPFEATVVDLSSSGCAVTSAITVLLGERIRISLALPSGSVELTGVVARTWVGADQDNYAGIQFDNLAPPLQRALDRFLIQQIPVQPPR